MTKSKNETKYCIVLKQAKIRYGNVGYGIEKNFCKGIKSRRNKICIL